jgi:hypothetical protein
MIGYSFTEIEALLSKAARGCGSGVADAARFGKAGALCLNAKEGSDLVNAALADLPKGVIGENAKYIQARLAHATGNTLQFSGGDALWEGYVTSLPYVAEQGADGAFTVSLDAFAKPVLPPRLFIADQNIANWQALAARNYVPETEQSRLAGAGAGLTDND